MRIHAALTRARASVVPVCISRIILCMPRPHAADGKARRIAVAKLSCPRLAFAPVIRGPPSVMDAFRIQGGARLTGRLTVEGSKNACLPLMAAALLADEPVTLHNAPEGSDIRNMARLLGELGCRVEDLG